MFRSFNRIPLGGVKCVGNGTLSSPLEVLGIIQRSADDSDGLSGCPPVTSRAAVHIHRRSLGPLWMSTDDFEGLGGCPPITWKSLCGYPPVTLKSRGGSPPITSRAPEDVHPAALMPSNYCPVVDVGQQAAVTITCGMQS